MLVAELLLRKKNIKLQIDDLEKHVSTEDASGNINKVINKLFDLEDILQRYVVILDKSNNNNKITVGASEVSVATAIRLKNNTKRKIDVLTDLINSNVNVDILNLIEQRTKLFEEYILFCKAIGLSDWSVEVD
jgi:hypothetical protein